MQEALQPLVEMLLLLTVIVLGSRVLIGYVARLAAWVDSGFAWSPGPVTTGSEGMLRRRGVARTALGPQVESEDAESEDTESNEKDDKVADRASVGKVRVGSELWNAVASEPVPPGGEVEVVAVEGLTLQVVPCPNPVSEKHSPENLPVQPGG